MNTRFAPRFLAVILTGTATTLIAAAPQKLDPDQLAFFEKKIRPALVENCYKCHSTSAEKVKGSLLLDSRDALLKGGSTGPAIVPGKPEKSLLIKFIKSDKDDERMPPKGDRLSDAVIADIEQWVKMGAPDPRLAPAGKSLLAVDMEKARKHWAFQPITAAPPVPKVKDAKKWAQSPLDKYVLARLEAKGLEPSPLTDRRTLIRRASYDLTGLPPTTQEVAEFVADKSPNAFEKVVDRLLASPRYGERWGRHWLDVARYADTTGDRVGGARKDNHFPYAWTFRDYVINAFNADKPYDQFLIEQIAADRLDLGGNKEPLAAMGFITVGKRFMGNVNEVIDDRIDVISQGLMGLTTACARCHDHKFDPIPQRDYYSLHGVFASSQEPEDEPVLRPAADKAAYDEFLQKMSEIEANIANIRTTEEQKALSQFRVVVDKYLLAARALAGTPNLKGGPQGFARTKGLDGDIFEQWVDSLKKWEKAGGHSIFAPWLAFAALKDEDFSEKAKPLAAQFASAQNLNPLVAKLCADAPAKIEDVAEAYGKLFREVEKAWHAAQKDELKTLDAPREEVRLVLYAEDSPIHLDRRGMQRIIGNKIQNLEAAERTKIAELKMSHPGSPPRAMALNDRAKPIDSFVMIRGEPANRGPVAPRQFLENISGDKREPFKNGSGRLEHAKYVASKDNPLTARVFVNRVWQWHFGDAIVRTPGDFGLRSEPPSNPELLDYMAAQFMADGWSVKKLHKLILHSSTWQQSSQDSARNTKIDPGNSLFWRQNIQRLDFESLRDTLLALGGKNEFDKMGGPSTDLTGGSTRRTVYGYVDRAKIPDAYRIFDFANPDMTSPLRMLTTVPLQALFMMNSPFVAEQSRIIASRPEMHSGGKDEEKVNFLYQLIHQRNPTAAELKLAINYLNDQKTKPALGGADLAVWQYGFGEYDAAGKQLKAFASLPTFLKDSWVLMDKEQLRKIAEVKAANLKKEAAKEKAKARDGLGAAYAVSLNAVGGQPGDEKHAVIRRWTAPRDGEISIEGRLGHKAKTGEGVHGFIFAANNGGQLGAWAVAGREQETNVERLTVKKGDAIDFIVTSRGKADDDSFTWAPVIRRLDAKPGEMAEWKAAQEFSGPLKEAAKSAPSFSAWERFSQAMLLANELIYVN